MRNRIVDRSSATQEMADDLRQAAEHVYAERQKGPIKNELTVSSELIADIEAAVSVLEGSINPILRDNYRFYEAATGEACGKGLKEDSSPLSEEVCALNNRLAVILHDIRIINEHVDI